MPPKPKKSQWDPDNFHNPLWFVVLVSIVVLVTIVGVGELIIRLTN